MHQAEKLALLNENYERIKGSGIPFIDKRIRYMIARIFTGKKAID